MKNKSEYVDGVEFHKQFKKIYKAPLAWAVNKKNQLMAKVLYEAPHQNLDFDDERRGRGKDYATWIFSEERPGQENIFSTKLELMIDATFEPDACVGYHVHDQTEEVYYILEGEITMTTVAPTGESATALLQKGDAHVVKLGQAHYGKAGKEGVRFICVAVRK